MTTDRDRRLQFWVDQGMSIDELALILGETKRDILDWIATRYTPAGVLTRDAA
jgi:hypothetical protein